MSGLGSRRRIASLSSLALLMSVLTVGLGSPAALAAPPAGQSEIQIRVVQDYNANGTWDDPFVEPGMPSVTVEVTSAAGATQTLTTDADGLVTFHGEPGDYTVSVINPDPTTYNPAFAWEKEGTAETPSASKLSSTEEFVTVTANATTTITTGFWEPRDYCQANPLIIDACQQPLFNNNGTPYANSGTQTLFTAPYRAFGNDRGVETVSTQGDTGTVYGIGYRKQDKRVFAGAYAKRGTAYGSGGSGAVYVTTMPAGSSGTTVWGTVPNTGTRPHDPSNTDNRQDWDFAPAVGKEGLGDVDISEDGSHLQLINLNTRELLVYDASTPTMEAPLYTVDLSANPGCAAASDWRPFGLGERNGVLYVGGVCSAESTQDFNDLRAIILTFDVTDGYSPIGTVMDQPLNYSRDNAGAACLPDDITYDKMTWKPWSNTIPCENRTGYVVAPTPMLSDIVVENDGSLVMSFRDRTADQHLPFTRFYTDTDGGGDLVAQQWVLASGDMNKACLDDATGMFVLDVNGACGIAAVPQGDKTGEFFSGDVGVNIHREAAYGGLALSRAERGIVTNAVDAGGSLNTQGHMRLERETGVALVSPDGGTSPTSPETRRAPDTGVSGNRISAADRFVKGQGMADIEVLCDQAPIQIGNRIWRDANNDGVQNAGEQPIAGVTVNLYDTDGDLVASTVTNSRGEYYFDSINDGVTPNTDYTIRLDDAGNYAAGEPLDTAEWELTAGNRGDDALDSDGTVVDNYPQISVTTGDHGDVNHTLDFGFVPTPPSVSVGDFVWVDSDGDGVQDSGEPGIEDVVLTLTGPNGEAVTDVYGNPVGPQTTDGDGHYSFDDLPALPAGQSYTVSIDRAASASALAPYVPTEAGQGDPDEDSSTWTATSGDLTDDGDRDDTLDFGFVARPKVSVGDFVWVDSDRDGVQDGGEPGIPGVVLVVRGPDGEVVTDVNGDPVGPQTTDGDGHYSFDDLPALPAGQSYTVSIDRAASASALAPYVPTEAGQGDPDEDSSTWTATSGDLTDDGDRDDTLDFGFVTKPKVSVGDFVWRDTDGNGRQDSGEPGIPGVSLILTGPDGKPVTDVNGDVVGPTTTDGNGEYSFDDLPALEPGESYTVSIDHAGSGDALQGVMPTTPGQGDGAGDSSTGQASSGDLTADGDRDATLDFGFIDIPRVSVGDLVWLDTDRDGTQDVGEPGIPGVVLKLVGPTGDPVMDVNGDPVGPQTTDASGFYTFANLPVLPAGESYTVMIDQAASADALEDLTPSPTGAGTPATDSSLWEAVSGDLVNDGDRDATLDFGFMPPPQVSVGDFVWLDADRDGVQDAGELGLPGVVLNLLGPDGQPVTDVDGNPVGPQTTDGAGGYSFDGLPALAPGQHYTVVIDQDASADALDGLSPTKTGEGTDATDSSTWQAQSGGLTNDGDRDDTLDFGFVTPAPRVSVGDFVWRDADGNGIQDDGPGSGIPGVVLNLLGPDGQPVTDVDGDPVGPQTTNGDGLYSFDDLPALPAGQAYTVVIDRDASADALSGVVPTVPGAGAPGEDSSTWTATSGELTSNGARDATLDFGFRVPDSVSLGDFVWVDGDDDGVKDSGEIGRPGVVLVLTGPGGDPVVDVFGNPVGPVTTDADGQYVFENLPLLPPGQGYTVTIDRDASGDALDGLDARFWSVTSTTDLSVPGAHAGELNLPLHPPVKPPVDPGDPDGTGDGSGVLPDTGSSFTAPYLLAALAALAVGGALAAGGRRMREREDAQ